ncbi:carbon storage regulator [Zavarzinella formosa]|uniref:carbon storage regulator n=1 Tax=Zavarzinella formosa TaxID=360055 RepID=UPI0002F30A6A|nr:carbon storage regulator [Zavarzinella formosa]
MLVITRKPGEDFLLDHGARLTVVSSHGGLVRFRIDNPRYRLATDGYSRIPGNGAYADHHADKSFEETVNLFPASARESLGDTEVILIAPKNEGDVALLKS